MPATAQDLMVFPVADFERLPEDGAFEVVDGRAIPAAGNDAPHHAPERFPQSASTHPRSGPISVLVQARP